MRLTLKGFSQDVSMENPEKPQDHLVFLREDGRELRLPVPQETVRALVKFVYTGEETTPVPESGPAQAPSLEEDDLFVREDGPASVAPLVEGATEFGAEEPDEDGNIGYRVPATEAEVRSL